MLIKKFEFVQFISGDQTQELRRCFKEVFKGKAKGEEIARSNRPENEYQCEKMCILNPKCTYFQFFVGQPVGTQTKCKLFKGNDVTKKSGHPDFTTYKLLDECCAKKISDGRPDATILEWYTDKRFYSIEDCRKKCEANLDCQEFRVKKSPDVDTSKFACALYMAGAASPGDSGAAKVHTFKLTAC